MNAPILFLIYLSYFCSLINSETLTLVFKCNGSEDIIISLEPGLLPDLENQYNVNIQKTFPVPSRVKIEFNAEAILTLNDNLYTKIYFHKDNAFFIHIIRDSSTNIHLLKEYKSLSFNVKGVVPGVLPYFKSIKINSMEYCKEPLTGFLDQYLLGYKQQAVIHKKNENSSCGKRRVAYTELIVNGASTKPGDWPWHVAIYRRDGPAVKYICGGTLISKSFVLTAAHCTSIRGVPVVPGILNVVLGKYNLVGGDVASQEREIVEIIVHDNFNKTTTQNDIALIKLKTIAVYDGYVQPACLWYDGAADHLPSSTVHGTVVGWGFDQSDALSTQLLRVKLQILPLTTCLKRNPVFYSNMLLEESKFCAGLQNGTSPCNGDSGGGFVVFVPDRANSTSGKAPGAWYVRGIVSVALVRNDASVCDPDQYAVFTDVAKYKNWIQNHIKDDIK